MNATIQFEREPEGEGPAWWEAAMKPDPWGELYCETLEAILRRGKRPADVAGSTSLRAAIGLTLGVLDQTTRLTESEAWAYLDPQNAKTVRGVMGECLGIGREIRAWQQHQGT